MAAERGSTAVSVDDAATAAARLREVLAEHPEHRGARAADPQLAPHLPPG